MAAEFPGTQIHSLNHSSLQGLWYKKQLMLQVTQQVLVSDTSWNMMGGKGFGSGRFLVLLLKISLHQKAYHKK